MLNQFSRTELLFGKEAMDILENSRVAVFGVGGVGGYTVEALVRSGVGAIDVIDDDKVCLTNLNRQIIATRKTIGQYKTDVCKERIHDINPNCEVTVHKCFFLPETKNLFVFFFFVFVVDVIDTVTFRTQDPRLKAVWVLVISLIRRNLRLLIYIRHRYARLPKL